MDIGKVLTLCGPNIWARFPVLEAWVDLGTLKGRSSDQIDGFNARLMEWLPTLMKHRCSLGEYGGFFKRLERGTYLAHVLEHVTLELQTLAGTEVSFGRAIETSIEGSYKVAVGYHNADLGKACLHAAREVCLAAAENRPLDIAGEVERLRQLAAESAVAPVKQAIRAAAHARNIPVFDLECAGMLQLGHGARQRRLMGSRTDRTGAIAETISQDRQLTRTMLIEAGVPAPAGRTVASADDAVAAAEDLGLPIVLKPRYGQPDDSEQSPLNTADEVRFAYERLNTEWDYIVAERFVSGRSFRLLVIGNRVVAAVEESPGESPPDATSELDLGLAESAVDAARVVGLDVALVRVRATTLSANLYAQQGAIVDVVCGPELEPFLTSQLDGGRHVVEALIEQVLPNKQTGRIPVVAVSGVNGKTTTTRLVTHILETLGQTVGMTCTDGIFISGRRIDTGDCSGPMSARAVLTNPAVDAAVLETARGGILRAGLGFDNCDVAVITNIGEGDHLGLAGIDTPAQLARVKRTLVEAVVPNGAAVLKADDPLVAEMAPHCPGSVIFFAQDPEHPIMVRRRADGSRTVLVRDNSIVLADGPVETPLVSLHLVPLTHGGRVGFQVENVLAATAAAWALGVPREVIRAALESFAANIEKAPGRFNLLEIGGATVIFDYGHNPSSLIALLETLDQFPHKRRTCVYSAAGDRRDSDMIRQGELLGGAFDRVILYEDHYLRGRAQGEIMGLFRQGLTAGRRVTTTDEVQGWLAAMELSLKAIHPGELLLIQADVVDESMDFVRKHLAGDHHTREISFAEALHVSPQPATAEMANSPTSETAPAPTTPSGLVLNRV